MENVTQQSHKLAEEMYKSGAGAGAAGAAPGGAGPAPEAQTDRGTAGEGADGGAKKDDDVIDAEFEVKE